MTAGRFSGWWTVCLDVSRDLPSMDSAIDTASAFSSYFDEKVHKIHVNLDDQSANSVFGRAEEAGTPTYVYSSNLVTFKVATEKEASEVIKKSATKTCALDPIPTQILKKHVSSRIPVITKLINPSMETRCIPSSFKKPLVTSLFKKINPQSRSHEELQARLQSPFRFQSVRACCASEIIEPSGCYQSTLTPSVGILPFT